MVKFKSNDRIKIVVPADDCNPHSKYNGMKGIYIRKISDENSLIQIQDKIVEVISIETNYLEKCRMY